MKKVIPALAVFIPVALFALGSFWLQPGVNSATTEISATPASTFTVDATETTSSAVSTFTSSASVTSTSETGYASQRPVQTLRDFNNAIVEIANNTNPAVVTVTTEQVVRFRQLDPFSMFFGEFGSQERERIRRGLGSGVIVSEDGVILTNYHVIEDAEEITVRLYEGEELTAEVVGSDPMMDIAVLRVDRKNLPKLNMGNSDNLQVGELVLAVGSPLQESLAHSVSMGIVSAKGRSIGIYENVAGYENFIQTDAAINPGNSGGALVNMDGELIGINSAIASRSGGNQGIGFAIPVNMVRQAMESILESGRVVRGFLGISWGGDVDQTMAKALKLDVNYGVIVGAVTDDGPAAKAGLKAEDVLIRLNGQPIRSWALFRTAIASTRPGEKIELEYMRDGKKRTVTVTLGEMEPETTAAVEPGARDEFLKNLGLGIQNLTNEIRSRLGLETEVEGVVVSELDQNSSAYRQGLRQGDVIMEVQGQSVDSANRFYQRLRELMDGGEEAVLFRVNRQGQRLFIALDLAK